MNAELTLRVIERHSDRIVVCRQLLARWGHISDEIFVYPRRAHQRARSSTPLAFSIPIKTKAYQVCRDHYGSTRRSPIARSHEPAAFMEARYWNVHVLSVEQEALSSRFRSAG